MVGVVLGVAGGGSGVRLGGVLLGGVDEGLECLSWVWWDLQMGIGMEVVLKFWSF